MSESFGWEHHRLYPGWTSTKKFVDTGERMEFTTSLGQDHHSEDSEGPDSAPSDGLSDGEGATDRESIVWDSLGDDRNRQVTFVFCCFCCLV